jgi:ATP-dependent exoDNAse (exonuclease V) alpha subunit
MSIMFFKVRSLSRAKGHNAVAKSAYISRSRVRDERLGRTHDYRRIPGLQHREIVLPSGIEASDGSWMKDRAQLWNAAEAAEPARNSRVGREYTLALPHELPPEARRELARGFARQIADRYGVAVDVAVHGPTAKGDPRNHHAHLLASTREITAEGFGPKATMEMNSSTRRNRGLGHVATEFRELRSLWAGRANEHLREAGLETRLEPRSRRTIEREQALALAPANTRDEPQRELRQTTAQRAVGNWVVYRKAKEAERGLTRTALIDRSRDLDHGLGL